MSDSSNDMNSSSEMTTLLTLVSGGDDNNCSFTHQHHGDENKKQIIISNDIRNNKNKQTSIQNSGRRRTKTTITLFGKTSISLLLVSFLLLLLLSVLILSPQRRCSFCCQLYFQKIMKQLHWRKNPTTTTSTLNDDDDDDDEWTPDVIFGNYSMPITFDDYDIDDYGDVVIDGTDGSSSSSSSKSSRTNSDIQTTFDTGLMECYGFANFEARKTASKLLSYTTTQTTTTKTTTTASFFPWKKKSEEELLYHRHLYYCPMCYWLLAMGYSPFINHPIISNMSDYENAAKAASIAFKEAHHRHHNNNNNNNNNNNTSSDNSNKSSTSSTTTAEKRSSSPSQLSFKELGLIDAMNVRFRSSFDNQTIGYRAYKERLQILHENIITIQQDDDDDDKKQRGGDVDVMAFLADSIMILYSNNNGYHFYNEDDNITPYPEIAYAITLLEDCLQQSPDHPLCQHLYIHVTEPSGKITTNKVASNVADNLYQGSNTSEAQHLQHMPSHIYLRIGRYHDAVTSNIIAHESDEKYLNNNQYNGGRGGGTPYGPGHDIAFLIYAAQHSGERTTAYRYSDILRNHYRKYPTKPDGPGTEQGWNIWRTVRLRFGDYQSVLDDNDDIDVNNTIVNGIIDTIDEDVKNSSDSNIQWPYAAILGHYSKGIATLWNKSNTINISINNTITATAYDDDDDDDRVSEAKKYLRSLRLLIPNIDPSFSGMARVANLTLTSAIEYYKYRYDYDITLPPEEILATIRKARIEQESWSYTEPPSWFNSVALCEGTLLRILGRYDEAILTFQRDLEIIPESRYGLFGLKEAMLAAGTYSTKEVKDVSKRFNKASYWSDSSIRNSAPLVCPELGK